MIKSQKCIHVPFFSGESEDDCKGPRELWFGQGSVIKSHKCINIERIFLVKVTMTVKTAPEKSGLLKVELSNLINIPVVPHEAVPVVSKR